jgi:hypothetical protein
MEDDLSGHEFKAEDTHLKEKETNISILTRMGKKLCVERKVFMKLTVTF